MNNKSVDRKLQRIIACSYQKNKRDDLRQRHQNEQVSENYFAQTTDQAQQY